MKPGAVYLGHIPHGFYENEMRGYFSQFGKVTRLKLFRSKKVSELLVPFYLLPFAVQITLI